MKRLIALIMALALMLGLTGCGGGGQLGDGDDVILTFTLKDEGYGTLWLEESCNRFMELVKDKEYPGGLTGVYCNVVKGTPPKADELRGSGYHVVFDLGVRSGAESGNLLNISANGYDSEGNEQTEEGINIFEEIYGDGSQSLYDMIPDAARYDYMGRDGEYYGLPTHENVTGVSYDAHLFDQKGYYFAKPTAEPDEIIEFESLVVGEEIEVVNNKTNETSYLTFNFVDPYVPGWENNKSCGPDGIFGTLDDGLPSSLIEFIVLCEKMKKDGVEPIVTTGEHSVNYSCVFMDGLVYSLLGEEKAKASRDLVGELDVVTTFKNPKTPLVPGVNYVPQAVTTKVNITEETGFYNMWTVERYYAMAMMEILIKQGWLGEGSDPTYNPASHWDTQKNFIFSGYNNRRGQCGEVGMLIESSFWYNESNQCGNFEDFYLYNRDVEKGQRDVRWMSLPVNIANTVTGEDATFTTNGITESVKGEKNVLPQSSSNNMVFNKNVLDDEAVLEALKDWLKFYFSNEELSNVTISQGMNRLVEYDMSALEEGDEWASFYKNLKALRDESYFLYECSSVSTGKTYNDKLRSQWGLGEGGKFFHVNNFGFGYAVMSGNFTSAKGLLAMDAFRSVCWTPEKWKEYYTGNNVSDVKYISGATYTEPMWYTV